MGTPPPCGEVPFVGRYSIERASHAGTARGERLSPMLARDCDSEDRARRQNEGFWIRRKLETFPTVGRTEERSPKRWKTVAPCARAGWQKATRTEGSSNLTPAEGQRNLLLKY
jgi:hypothetical protein